MYPLILSLAALRATVKRKYLERKARKLESAAARLDAFAKQCRAEARSFWGESQLASRAARDLSDLARDAHAEIGDAYHPAIVGYRQKAGDEFYSAELFDEMAGERNADAFDAEQRANDMRLRAAQIRKDLTA